MKTISHYRGLVLSAVSAFVLIVGLSQAKADHYRYDEHHDRAYGDAYYSHHGYWDGHHHFHNYVWYGGHQGYWDTRNGIQVFISL